MKNFKMNIRHSLTPQMMEYDSIGETWIPYLMYFHRPNYFSKVVNTDFRGFRITHSGNDRIPDFINIENSPVCLLIGGSFAFGVGATDDKKTIPSILNNLTNYTWLNFGGRAYSSTQELLLFLFYYQQIKNIKKIVILSGLNNFVLYYMSKQYPREIGTFFSWNKYNKIMNFTPTPSIQRRVATFILQLFYGRKIDRSDLSRKELVEYLFRGNIEDKKDPNKYDKEDLLHVLKRDILIWKALSKSIGCELTYVLQPFTNWIHKKTSCEEDKLFAELDSYPQNHWQVLKKDLGYDQYIWFLDRIRSICGDNSISFFDMNHAISKMNLDRTWLYVDRAHFNDEGNRIVANILKEEVIDK